MPEELKEWGYPLDSTVCHATMSNCEKCKWEFPLDLTPHIVGFTPFSPGWFPPRENQKRVIIIDCPKCQSKIWAHITADDLDKYKNKCPRWPKE